MAKIGRNQPCRCGSGAKTKRCCGVPSGPSPDQQARAFLHAQKRQWAPLLAGYSDDELDALADQVAGLPRHDLSLQLPLPRLLPATLERLRQAIAHRDPDSIIDATPDALELVDTPTNRQRLAQAVLTLHDHGHHLECDTTALAIIELAVSERSGLVFSALYHALAVAAGNHTTPAGLHVATRPSAA